MDAEEQEEEEEEELGPAPGQLELTVEPVELGRYTDPMWAWRQDVEARQELKRSRHLEQLRGLRDELWRRRAYHPHVCGMCRRVFLTWRPVARWCSNACRQRAYRRRRSYLGAASGPTEMRKDTEVPGALGPGSPD